MDPTLEAAAGAVITASQLAEDVLYTPVGSGQVTIRAVFKDYGHETDLDGFKVATSEPTLDFEDLQLGQPGGKGDLVTVNSVDYVVKAAPPSVRGWSHCLLHKVP